MDLEFGDLVVGFWIWGLGIRFGFGIEEFGSWVGGLTGNQVAR